MYRRSFVCGLAGVAFNFLSVGSAQAVTAGKVFNISWRDLNVGYSKINVSRINDELTVQTNVEIYVKLFGIEFFKYKLSSEEVWRDKKIMSLNSQVRIGNKTEFATVKRIGKETYKIEGSKFDGIISGNPATTSYFTPDFMNRTIWISTQNGKPLKIKTERVGQRLIESTKGPINAFQWRVTGDLNINLFYDKKDEWVGSSFKAGGSTAKLILYDKVGSTNQIWTVS